ncbi:Hypp1778 [Branchiostoma lanceolatum]|uniref:Hypp1778 protein n=1 Tax=Branchiostoma lanceolatum TaxID=7740 RepID=A0A8J9ZMN6_BRALA|nr:Hypp1778 [Branchiostoma lanceolatum]
MAESRRSGRAHRKVDYSKFGGNDEGNDSEDDFADFNPPAKKKKIEQKETKKKEPTKKMPSSKTSDKAKKEQRLSLEEKLYQRDLELALQLSQQDAPSSSQTENSSQSELEQAATKEDSSDIASVPTPSTDSAERPVETQSADSDVEEPSTRKKRQARLKTTPKSTNKENGGREEESRVEDIDDEEDVSSEEEDSDFDPDEDDSDYETSKKRQQSRRGRGRGRGGASEKRPRPKPRLSATVTPIKTFSGKSASPRPRGKGLGRAIVGLSAALSYNSDGSSGRDSPDVSHMVPARSSSGELIIRKPKWCPPGPAGTSKSGGGGGGAVSKSPAPIRVGLSKNQKLKPLHPVRPASNGD